MGKLPALILLTLLSACSMKSGPTKAQVVMPQRSPTEEVILIKCQEGYACLDIDNFKKLLHNEVSTETYIQQLKNLIDQLASQFL